MPITTLDPKDEYVPVYVPRERLTDVYRLLGNAPGDERIESSEELPPDAAPAADEDGWSGTADERFRNQVFVDTHLASRSETVREAAKYLADRADSWITSEEIASALGLPHGWNSLAGAFGAAGRYFANRDIGLPWDWTYHTPDGRIRLRMDPEVAKVVSKAL